MGRVTFACGAFIRAIDDPTPHASNVRDGRVRLVVYDSDKQPSRPWMRPPSGAPDDDGDGPPQDCLRECKHKRPGGRRQVRCFSERGLPVRWIVTCYGRWEP
jgi:hypothetical protein